MAITGLDIAKSTFSGVSSIGNDIIQQTVSARIRARIQNAATSPDQPFAEKWAERHKELTEAEPIKSFNKFDPALIIINLVTLEEIRLQFVPKILEYTPESNFVSLPSMGRNNPFYQYTGSEDILGFEIDWFFETEDTKDVLERCKKLEAMTKNNGYDMPPPLIKLLWNNVLFNKTTWLMTSAKYTLSNWNGQKAMLPRQAIQQVVLRKVTDSNFTHDTIRHISS